MNWYDPRITMWTDMVAEVRRKFPNKDLIPTYPPMMIPLPEQVDKILSQKIVYADGCHEVYQELKASNGGRGVAEGNHQMMPLVEVSLQAVSKLPTANVWHTEVAGRQHTHFQPGMSYAPPPAAAHADCGGPPPPPVPPPAGPPPASAPPPHVPPPAGAPPPAPAGGPSPADAAWAAAAAAAAGNPPSHVPESMREEWLRGQARRRSAEQAFGTSGAAGV